MPKLGKSLLVHCRHYKWRLSKRGQVWSADGRSNEVNLGRHSLETYNKDEAFKSVHELDEQMAIKLGKIAKRPTVSKDGLTILEAIERFRDHKRRPLSVGGVESQTLSRYDRILNKFKKFVAVRNVRFASEINFELFDEYVTTLEDEEFAHTTIVTEMVLLKSLHQFCIDEKILDPRFRFKYPLRRPNKSLTYCPTMQEVNEIHRICQAERSLTWLFRVVSVLSNTGLRFGEARDLEWRDVNQGHTLLQVRDESYLNSELDGEVRKTKTRKSRTIPILSELAEVLAEFRSESGRILSGPQGGKLRNDFFGDTLRKQVIPKVAKAVGGKDILRLTAHGFRHYFVSRCANAGVPQLSVMNWLGHSTAKMTNYYYHSNEAASLMHMRQLEEAESLGRRDLNQST